MVAPMVAEPHEPPGPSEEDLHDNRAGRLSARQREVLSRALQPSRVALAHHHADPARALTFEERGGPVALFVLGGTVILVGALLALSGSPEGGLRAIAVAVPTTLAALLLRHRAWLHVVIGRSHARLARAVATDLDAGKVVSGLGRLAFEGRQYALRVDGRLMRCPDPSRWALPTAPGTHLVHYLPGSRVVVAMERAAAPVAGSLYRARLEGLREPKVDLDALTDSLCAAHGFDPGWLAHNRRDRLAPGQVRHAAASPARVALWVLLFFFAIPLLFALLSPGELPVSWLLLAAPIDLALAIALSGLWSPLLDALSGRARALQGPLRVELRHGDAGVVCTYLIGGEKIRGDEIAARALLPGISYRLWVLPRAGDLVGIEAVDVLQE